MRIAGVVVMLMASSVAAQPKPSARPACLPLTGLQTRLLVNGPKVTVCGTDDGREQCVSVSTGKSPVAIAAPPKAEPTLPAVTLGKNAKEAAAVGFAGNPEGIAVSKDGKVLIVGASVWSIAKDKQLALKQPKEYAKTKEKAGVMDIYPAGSMLIANWYACAGPCAHAVAVTTDGKNVGAWFPGGIPVALSGNRIAIVPDSTEGPITLIQAPTAKQLGTLSLGDGVISTMKVATTGEDSFVITWEDQDVMDSRHVVWVSAPVGKPMALASRVDVPACP